jgi:DNA polymerase III delta subunit
VSSEPLKPVYLITGTDLPKVALALRRLRARFQEGSIEELFAESATGTEVVAAANALGLFGGGERLVTAEGIERWKKTDVDAIAAYLSSPTPGSVLALVGDPARPSGLAEICAEAGTVLRYDVPTRPRGRQLDYGAWVRAQLERSGLRADRDTAERLVEIVGNDTFALAAEIDKLSAWATDGTVRVEDVELLAVPSYEVSNFALGDAWGARDVAGALSACESKLLEDEPYIVAARFSDYVGRIRRVHSLLEYGLEERAIAERLGLKFPFPARKQVAQAGSFSREELARATLRVAELDVALKGGSRLAPDLELERALVEVTQPGG